MDLKKNMFLWKFKIKRNSVYLVEFWSKTCSPTHKHACMQSIILSYKFWEFIFFLRSQNAKYKDETAELPIDTELFGE